MDVIITAIIVGFLASLPIKFVMLILKKRRELAQADLALKVNELTLTIRVDQVTYNGADSLYLVFDAMTDKFVTQGTIAEVSAYLKAKFKTKSIFLIAADGSAISLLKPAELQ